MLRAAIAFFVVGFIAFLLGAYQMVGITMELGKILLGTFLFIAVLLFIAALFVGKKIKQL